jgi:hypothetical protein
MRFSNELSRRRFPELACFGGQYVATLRGRDPDALDNGPVDTGLDDVSS